MAENRSSMMYLVKMIADTFKGIFEEGRIMYKRKQVCVAKGLYWLPLDISLCLLQVRLKPQGNMTLVLEWKVYISTARRELDLNGAEQNIIAADVWLSGAPSKCCGWPGKRGGANAIRGQHDLTYIC